VVLIGRLESPVVSEGMERESVEREADDGLPMLGIREVAESGNSGVCS
jgi:hypothetical protein